MDGKEVKLHGWWASPFALRVIWSLKIKGVEYDYVEENLPEQSPLLLQYNPVYKKIPVLVHHGKPIAESLVIMEYIDETWKQNPLLPQDPYERAKCTPVNRRVFRSTGEEQQKALTEVRENWKLMESGLEGKRFFGGEQIGFADVANAWIGYWTRIVQEVVGIKLIDEESVPLLAKWFRDILEIPLIKESLPPQDKFLAHIKAHHKALTATGASS
ncbi:hypothetical protein Ancab_038358 [Ancistrocladus abbreviatus]